MTLDELRHLVELLPPGGAVLLTREALLPALSESPGPALVKSDEPPDAPDEWLTAKQVAERFNVSARYAYDHQKQLGGRRLSRRCTRFSAAAAERWMARRTPHV